MKGAFFMRALGVVAMICLCLSIFPAKIRDGGQTPSTTGAVDGVRDDGRYDVPFSFHVHGEAILNGRPVSGRIDVVRAGEYVLVDGDGTIIRFKAVDPEADNHGDSGESRGETWWPAIVFLGLGVIGIVLIFHGKE
jgi:hypothetical protein